MGNTHVRPLPRPRNKKQVHWRAADRPSPPGKPHLAPDSDLTPDLVTICWTKPTRDGGSPITGYLVEHRRTGSPHWVRASPVLTPIPELTISGLEPGWRYQFRVSAENAVGLSDHSDVSEPLTVTQQKYAITAPKFTDDLIDVTVLENEKVEFVAHLLGQPMPKICWYKDGFEIFSSRRTRILTENGKSILTIHQTALADEGEIKCTATNKAGHASTKARLNLEAPPSIRLPRQYEDGLLFEIGEVLRLKVSVAGRPTPLVFWSHNGESIQNNDRYEIEYVDRCSILKIGEARREDRGEYHIKAVNKIGADLASFLVTITDKPSPPGRARVLMTLGRSVTLSWGTPYDDGGCKIGNYIIEYYRLGWNVWLKAATSRQLTTTLGDLIEGSEYKFRVKAESPYGVSDPSEESNVIFIPDPRRGITSPQARSRSQPKDIIAQITAPIIATRTKTKPPRSQSSNTKADSYVFYDDVDIEPPIRPERTKIKSPPKTPDVVRKQSMTNNNSIHQNILDRTSLARELAYGSPEIKVKKNELNPPPTSINSDKSQSLNLTPRNRTSSPVNHADENKKEGRMVNKKPVVISRENSENIEGSTEFMLVLYPNTNEEGEANKKMREFDFDFDDVSIPPPISLSAPELGVEPPLFGNLKPSASSTELLHERAMIRFNEAAAAEEADISSKKIPRIQINSKDDSNIVGLERKNSRRRQSHGGVVQQQVLWAQRRFSLKNSGDFSDLVENNLHKQKSVKMDNVDARRELMMSRQRSESEEKEEAELEKIRGKHVLQGQSSFERRSIDVVEEEKWLEEYEESLSEESESESEDERYFNKSPQRQIYSDEDEDMYHPGIVVNNNNKQTSEEPFEILTKRNKLPDPNFVPKPILKKSDEKIEINRSLLVEAPRSKVRSHSPMPQDISPSPNRQRSFSLAHPIKELPDKSKTFPYTNQARQRSLSLSPKHPENLPKKNDLTKLLSSSSTHCISVVAQITGITAASIVIPQKLLEKQNDAEEGKVVVDHYADIVRTVSQKKQYSPQSKQRKDSWKSSEDEVLSLSSLTSSDRSVYNEPKAVLQERKFSISKNPWEERRGSTSPGVYSEANNVLQDRKSSVSKSPWEERRASTSPGVYSEANNVLQDRKSSVSKSPWEERRASTSTSTGVYNEANNVLQDWKSSVSKSPWEERRASTSTSTGVYNEADTVLQNLKSTVCKTPWEERRASTSTGVGVINVLKDPLEGRRSSEILAEERSFRQQPRERKSSSDSNENVNAGGKEIKSIKVEPKLLNDNVQKRENRSPTPQRGRSSNRNLKRTSGNRSKTPSKPQARLENWSEKPQNRKSKSPSPRPAKQKSPIPYSRPRPMLREIMTQTSVGLEFEYSSDSRTSSPSGRSRQEELIAKAEVKVRSAVDYVTDLAMFCVACWLYLFSNELLAIPVLIVMVYRQLQDEVRKRIPRWILRRLSKRAKAKKN